MNPNTTFLIGTQLVKLCNTGKALEAINTLYAPNIVSIEAVANPNFSQRLEGLAAVKGKAEWWIGNHEIHKEEAQGPWPHGERFIVRFLYEVTAKTGPMAGQRMKLDEAALYTVKDGKIVQEEFFYFMG